MKKLTRRRIYLMTAVALLLSAPIVATRKDPNALANVEDCPRIRCAGQSEAQPIRFRVLGGLSDTTYRWSVSSGSISGPNTGSQITVASIPRGPCTATVRMEGIPDDCSSVQRCTTYVGPCPDVSISCPGSVRRGQIITIEGSIAQAPRRTDGLLSAHAPLQSVTYDWSISAGEIISGQGTPSIRIDTSSVPAGTSISVTVVVNFSTGCSTTTTCTTAVRR